MWMINAGLLLAQQVGQQIGPPQFTWGNIAEIMSIVASAAVLYGRLVKLETKIDPIWRWWVSTVERRASESVSPPYDLGERGGGHRR